MPAVPGAHRVAFAAAADREQDLRARVIDGARQDLQRRAFARASARRPRFPTAAIFSNDSMMPGSVRGTLENDQHEV
jgi:hypothetical protein